MNEMNHRFFSLTHFLYPKICIPFTKNERKNWAVFLTNPVYVRFAKLLCFGSLLYHSIYLYSFHKIQFFGFFLSKFSLYIFCAIIMPHSAITRYPSILSYFIQFSVFFYPMVGFVAALSLSFHYPNLACFFIISLCDSDIDVSCFYLVIQIKVEVPEVRQWFVGQQVCGSFTFFPLVLGVGVAGLRLLHFPPLISPPLFNDPWQSDFDCQVPDSKFPIFYFGWCSRGGISACKHNPSQIEGTEKYFIFHFTFFSENFFFPFEANMGLARDFDSKALNASLARPTQFRALLFHHKAFSFFSHCVTAVFFYMAQFFIIKFYSTVLLPIFFVLCLTNFCLVFFCFPHCIALSKGHLRPGFCLSRRVPYPLVGGEGSSPAQPLNRSQSAAFSSIPWTLLPSPHLPSYGVRGLSEGSMGGGESWDGKKAGGWLPIT